MASNRCTHQTCRMQYLSIGSIEQQQQLILKAQTHMITFELLHNYSYVVFKHIGQCPISQGEYSMHDTDAVRTNVAVYNCQIWQRDCITQDRPLSHCYRIQLMLLVYRIWHTVSACAWKTAHVGNLASLYTGKVLYCLWIQGESKGRWGGGGGDLV